MQVGNIDDDGEASSSFGPAHDGERVFDRRYDGGSWDLLSVGDKDSLTLLGFSAEPMRLTGEGGEQFVVQAGQYIMVRSDAHGYSMIVGGGA